ncbi:MAG: hypothetical protein HYY18_18890 [Planctomycetes bacterium]|nr:hypothetical protein [Planctomycetota bacterium]
MRPVAVVAAVMGVVVAMVAGMAMLLLQRRIHSEHTAETAAREAVAVQEAGKAAASDRTLADQLAEERRRREAAEERVSELEAKVRTLEGAKAPAEAATPPPAAETDKKKGLCVGEELSEEAVKDLGLDLVAANNVNRILKEEEQRLTEALRAFYAENVKADDPAIYEQTAKQLVIGMVNRMTADLVKLENLPAEEKARMENGSTSLEEILGPETFTSRLAREMHGVRAGTYDELGRFLNKEQLEKLRGTWLGEGAFIWPGGVNADLGPAPPDLRR